jgi:3-phosphoshikimate 1-carboxyvinyltransferase
VKVSVSGRLSSADLSPFLEFLKSAGAQADYSVSFPARLHGPISLQERIYSGGLGSQFLSGILLVSPLVENGASIGVAGSLAGISHVKETIILMKECGIRFHSDSLPFLSLTGRQGYSPPSEIIVHSSPYLSAFPLLAGALCGKATLKGSCDWQSHCEVFREFGAAVSMHRHEISVSASSLAGAQLEASELGEYLLHAMVLASASDGQTTISNLHSLPLRHQSRARKLARELGRMGARINEEKGGFTINGGKLIGAKVEPDGDASVAMACACAAVCASGTTTIMGAECVEKSYPGFFLGLESLGATVR